MRILGLAFLVACNSYTEDELANSSLLEEIVGRWWSLQNQDDNIYLDQYNDKPYGIAYIDYINGPFEALEANPDLGDWEYLGNGHFFGSHPIDGEWNIHIKAIPDSSCWDVRVFLIHDTACPYLGED